MKYKIVMVALAVLTAAVVFLYFENYRISQQLEELSKTKEEVKITPAKPSTPAVIDPGAVSPFDKPNNDPIANMNNQENAQAYPLTTVKFEKTSHDFGRIDEGAVVNTTFTFTNSGKNPLIISSARGSCGCTVPKWPKEPIKPGETGVISVQFNSSGKHSETEKMVSVVANTDPTVTNLSIKSTVVPKDK